MSLSKLSRVSWDCATCSESACGPIGRSADCPEGWTMDGSNALCADCTRRYQPEETQEANHQQACLDSLHPDADHYDGSTYD